MKSTFFGASTKIFQVFCHAARALRIRNGHVVSTYAHVLRPSGSSLTSLRQTRHARCYLCIFFWYFARQNHLPQEWVADAFCGG